MTDRPPTPKAEALRALAHVREMLICPLVGLNRVQAVSALEYAREQVEAIQEVKRVRRARAKAEE